MPSKLLIEAANAYHRRGSFDTFGIQGASALSVDFPAVMQRVRAMRDDFVASTLALTDTLGKRSVAGRALRGPGLWRSTVNASRHAPSSSPPAHTFHPQTLAGLLQTAC